MNIPDFVEVYENEFSKEFCEKVIAFFNTAHERNLTLNRQEHDGAPQVDKKDNALFLPSYPLDSMPRDIFSEFSDIFWGSVYTKYEEKYGALKKLDKHANYTMKVQKTEPSEGYHIWHCENNNLFYKTRCLSWILYLNDVEQGGETEFLYLSKRINPKAGRLIIFPAGFTHTHRGNPPLSGEKYIATGWVEYAI